MATVVDASGNSPHGGAYVDKPTERLYEQTLAATGATTGFQISGKFNLTLSGTWVGTATIKRSFDGGATYQTVAKNSSGDAASFTANTSLSLDEPEKGVLYQIDWTRTSGSITVRFSR